MYRNNRGLLLSADHLGVDGPAGVQRGDDPRVPRLHRQRHLLLRTELRISQPRRLPSQPCKKYSPKESKKKGQFNNLK